MGLYSLDIQYIVCYYNKRSIISVLLFLSAKGVVYPVTRVSTLLALFCAMKGVVVIYTEPQKNVLSQLSQIKEYCDTLTARVNKGREYIEMLGEHPAQTADALRIAHRLLRELEYREIWTKRYIAKLEALMDDSKFGYVVYIISPFARFVNMLCVMIGSRSGIEDNKFMSQLAEFTATNRTFRALENKLAALDEGWSMTPDELQASINDFAIQGYNSWLEFRRWITKI